MVIQGRMRCLARDFNGIRYSSEMLGCDRFTYARLELSDFTSDSFLMDFPLEGGSFNWYGNQRLPPMPLIDRFLVFIE